uniref:AMP-binding enzyme n=1 Tax=Candidatus Kentrum sp. TC TaxID=2126339 RepID=A0A450ZTG8_9GAMM|nr:MAG: AMP-binding enzyme [Candidatus Kentron sp. TC]
MKRYDGVDAHSEHSNIELSAAERHEILVEWNDTRTDYPKDKCIHQLFEEQVERTPDAIAVVFKGKRLTYQALNRRANRLARHLQSLGVEPETLVGVCVERSLEMIVGLLAILKAGGAYVPLNPSYPKERIAFMPADAEVGLFLTQERLVGGLPEHRARIVGLDADWEDFSEENPVSDVGPGNLAYVIYTSGSTGKPKGVAISHRAVNRLVFNTNYIELSSDDVVAQASNVSFDAATFEIWGALLHGARLVGITKLLFFRYVNENRWCYVLYRDSWHGLGVVQPLQGEDRSRLSSLQTSRFRGFR